MSKSTPSTYSSFNSTSANPASNSPKKGKKFFMRSLFIPVFIILLIVGVMGFISYNHLKSSEQVQGVATSLTPTKNVAIQKAKVEQDIHQEFLFPLRDQKGKEVSKLKYEIQNVELRDEIVIKGERATAIKGRTFLIVNLKITNDYNKSIQLNARDYLRLSAGKATEKLAPDIHNDPVEVQAISTKFTRVGFPIDSKELDLSLQIGEIQGKKELIKLDLK